MKEIGPTQLATKSTEEIERALSKHLPQPLYQPRKQGEELKIRTMNDKGEPEKKTNTEIKSQVPNKRQVAIDAQKVVNGDFTAYQLPPASLLNNPKKVDQPS